MGRKIKGKKHRGVKDPREQAARRFQRDADKINRPPPSDEQEVPRRLLELTEPNNTSQLKKKSRKKLMTELLSTADFLEDEGDTRGATRPVKNSEIITQQPGEKQRRFMMRINESFEGSLREAYFEEQFGVQVQRDALTGKVTDVIKDRYEAADIIKKMEESKTVKKRKKKEVILPKREKWKAKLRAKVEIKNEKRKMRDFSDFKDEVKFGEVVHRPPEITALPRMKVKSNSGRGRPGEKDLLLKAILEGAEERQKVPLNLKTVNKPPDVSMARKKMLEEERKRVVKLYRLMKGKDKL